MLWWRDRTDVLELSAPSLLLPRTQCDQATSYSRNTPKFQHYIALAGYYQYCIANTEYYQYYIVLAEYHQLSV